ncbi:MAG: nitroreductase family protein [Chloroflexi bacterium]|nr:nitroreductase family protein [Chloroflexota bacterium]
MKFSELVLKNRSYRRFDQNVPVPHENLVRLIDLARLAASPSNLQGLKFLLVSNQAECGQVFQNVRFGGYFKDWGGPVEGERPSAYIILLGDTTIKPTFEIDAGIAAQTILLGAAELGFGGCMVKAFMRESLRRVLDLEEKFEIVLVIALGKPAETCVIEDYDPEKGIEYYRDAEGVHHVPKRRLDELIVH